MPAPFQQKFKNLWFKTKFTAKVWGGLYAHETVDSCLICGTTQSQTLRMNNQRLGLVPIGIRECQGCGFVFQSPRLQSQSLRRFYDGDYRKALASPVTESRFVRGIRRGGYQYRFIEEGAPGFLKNPKQVLEIGCGTGGILQVFKNEGHSVLGVEWDPKCRVFGETKDIKMVEDFEFLPKGKKFDLVVLSHVLEHVEEPKSFLKRIKELLSADGVIYIEVPGRKRSRERFEESIEIAHLWYFDQENLRTLLTDVGFHFLLSNERVQAVFRTQALDHQRG